MSKDQNKDEHEKSSALHTIIDRLALGPIWRKFFVRRVPKARWYYGDGATLLFLLGILIVTGFALGLMYSPSPETAYQSLVHITNVQAMGWFVRGLHYWSAGMMVVILLYHVFRHILLGGYLPPREGTWVIGVLMFFLVIINSYIGYTLRWDERSVYAIRVALNIFHRVPWIGDELVYFVQGGWTQGNATLSRLYTVHVMIVPILLLGLASYHLYLVVFHGVTTVPERVHPVETAEEQKELYDQLKHSKKEGETFFPYTMVESQIFAFVIFCIVLALTLTLGPQELMREANFTETSFPAEEWWFHWYSALVAYLPPQLTSWFYVGFPIALFLYLMLLPFVDHGANRGLRRRPLAVGLTVVVGLGLLSLTGLRLQSEWTAWPRAELAPLPQNTELTPSAQLGHTLFTKYSCFSCHALGGTGGKIGPELTRLTVRLSADELRHFISQPPQDVAMPAYGHRLSEDELKALVDFVLVAQTFPHKY
ncbi:MAG TPA: cytochrome b N-terminal domain-containing protein [Oligoflexus sp.]|uniref:cytochrome b N-terminal domain-containing protein n=1 Tax=Oligoflexus sp. TaxID=1971216 RepID=UPI002D38C030|nr:cytochrome b N-terminal domain-containing protein [Oligoflexus sp.]HYX32465.1 cytochrome b N-terminal domain-containing protein [Oligoflexus sp.]